MKPFWYRMFFSTVGKPRKWVRKVVFRSDRTARPLFHRMVHKRNGAVRAHWAYWVASAPARTASTGSAAVAAATTRPDPDVPGPAELALRQLRPFEDTVADWRRADPLPARMTAQEIVDRLDALGPAASAGIVVAASHDNYREIIGGVQLCLQREEREAVARNMAYLQVHPAQPLPCLAPDNDDPRALPVTLVLNGTLIGTAAMADLEIAVVQSVRMGRSVRLVVHHLLGHAPEALVALAQAAKLPEVVFWLHDFFTLCPSFTLQRNGMAFCSAPDVRSNACGLCVYGPARPTHQARIAAFFGALPVHVVAPSQVTADFWMAKAGLPVRGLSIVPHVVLDEQPRARPASVAATAPVRVAYVGAPATHKGWPVFLDLMHRKTGSDPQFLVFSDRRPGVGEDGWHPVRVTAEEPDAMAQALARAGVDVVVHWASWPETFSFTTFEALAAGAFVLTNPVSGNVRAAVEATGRGAVVPDVASLEQLLADGGLARLAAARRSRVAATDLASRRSAMSFDLPGWG
jgi:glycosyltransferase involved in cell wall biosynthesis